MHLEKYPRHLYFSIGNCHLFVCGVHVCGFHVVHLFCALCCLIMCLNVLSSCTLRFPHKNHVRFVFTSCLMCVCLRIVVSNTYCLCFCFVFSPSCVPYNGSFSVLSIKVITKLPNSEQSYKGKVKTHNYINRQNQSTTGKL